MCPFSILAFLQPTTVDKEPYKYALILYCSKLNPGLVECSTTTPIQENIFNKSNPKFLKFSLLNHY